MEYPSTISVSPFDAPAANSLDKPPQPQQDQERPWEQDLPGNQSWSSGWFRKSTTSTTSTVTMTDSSSSASCFTDPAFLSVDYRNGQAPGPPRTSDPRSSFTSLSSSSCSTVGHAPPQQQQQQRLSLCSFPSSSDEEEGEQEQGDLEESQKEARSSFASSVLMDIELEWESSSTDTNHDDPMVSSPNHAGAKREQDERRRRREQMAMDHEIVRDHHMRMLQQTSPCAFVREAATARTGPPPLHVFQSLAPPPGMTTNNGTCGFEPVPCCRILVRLTHKDSQCVVVGCLSLVLLDP